MFQLLARVILVAQSLLPQEIPLQLEQALQHGGQTVTVVQQGLETPRRPKDVVILQPTSPPQAQALVRQAQTTGWVEEAWLPPPPDLAAWRASIRADLPLWQEAAAPLRLIPAAQAMARLSEAIERGQAAGVTSMTQILTPEGQATDKGQYFLTMLRAAVIQQTSPLGTSPKLTRSWRNREAVISATEAEMFQRLAWQVAQDLAPPPVTAAPAAPPLTPITNPNLAMGLNGISDWSPQLPFLDLMKSARVWTGHLPGQFGGWDAEDLRRVGALDQEGWLRFIPKELASVAALVLVDLPADAQGAAGRYLLRYQGKGRLTIEGRVGELQYGPQEARFTFTPGEGAVSITIHQTDPADPLRQLTLVREDRAPLLDAGQIFNPDFLGRLRGVKTLRFMDWMQTNNSPLQTPSDRPLPSDYSYTWRGVPIEVIVALANELGANPWLTLPHLADDNFARLYATYTRDHLAPDLVAHLEYSNEVWNWQFSQATWTEEQGKQRWGRPSTWVQFYALRATQIAQIWHEIFGPEAPSRLVRIISTQTGYLGLEEMILEAADVQAEGKPAPATQFDAYAITGYFSGSLGDEAMMPLVKDWLQDSQIAAEKSAKDQNLTGHQAQGFIAAHRYDLAVTRAITELQEGKVAGKHEGSLDHLLGTVLPYHQAIAQKHGLRLMMYEGGTHILGFGAASGDAQMTEFLTYLNYTPQIAAVYGQVMTAWARLTPEPFMAFVDIATPSRWGSWGALRHLGDDNPRWQALAKGCIAC